MSDDHKCGRCGVPVRSCIAAGMGPGYSHFVTNCCRDCYSTGMETHGKFDYAAEVAKIRDTPGF